MVFVVPSLLASTVPAEPSPARLAWLAQLEDTVHEVAQRWSLTLGAPFEPGGQTAWVAPARDPAGRDMVLKVGWVHPEAEHEPEGLRAWHGHGTVLIYDACRLGQSSALLLEPGLARAGAEMFAALPGTAQGEVLLCTDLHAGNVLAAQREPWLVIDPKPFVGDPCYDVLQHLLNCEERLTADPAGLARRMADLVDVDADRVTQWLFARCVIEGVDNPQLQAVATALAPT